MIRLATIFWLLVAAGLGGALYQVKNQVLELEDKLAGLNRTILKDQEAIHVLHAEWSYLNQPERLSGLSTRHLDLQEFEAAQIVMIDDLPTRLIKPNFEPSAPADDLDTVTSPMTSQATPSAETKAAGFQPAALSLSRGTP